jgi:hypothetical protein
MGRTRDGWVTDSENKAGLCTDPVREKGAEQDTRDPEEVDEIGPAEGFPEGGVGWKNEDEPGRGEYSCQINRSVAWVIAVGC